MRKKLAIGLAIIVVLIASIFVVYPVIAPEAKITLNVTPDSLKGDAIAGQHVVYLVTLGPEASQRAALIIARASNSAVFVQPSTITTGQVAEVTVIPDVGAVGQNVTLTINANELDGGRTVASKSLNFTVVSGEDWVSDKARQIRDMFVQWLEVSHPELDITNQTQWVGTIVSPVWLVVTHYLFFSGSWEMHVYWHVMIPPYDWARIDLRHRFTQTAPSLSFEISSLNATLAPQPITPPASVWR